MSSGGGGGGGEEQMKISKIDGPFKEGEGILKHFRGGGGTTIFVRGGGANFHLAPT